MKRSGSNDQSQPRFKKKVSGEDLSRGSKVKLAKGSGSQSDNPTFATCGERNYGSVYWIPEIFLVLVRIDTR